MRYEPRQPKTDLRTDNFDSAVVQAAYTYHLQIGPGHPKSYLPGEVAAFIAGACWARQVLVGEENK